MLIQRIKLKNFLSFGPDAQELELKPLNVLIGPNGSGKSNLVAAFGLLQAAPADLAGLIRSGGGVSNWIWRNTRQAVSARLEAVIENPHGQQPLRYALAFTESGQRLELTEEAVANEHAYPGHQRPYFYYEFLFGKATLNYKDASQRELRPEEIEIDQSILAQRKDPDHYPELTYVGKTLGQIRCYTEWSFGRSSPARQPQPADLPNSFLLEHGENLGLMLSRVGRDRQTKVRFLNALRQLYEGLTDYHVNVEYGTVQVFLEEGDLIVPASRLSDGTLRYLCLLVILCDPAPAPLICLEEPELGLHPDILPGLAELLREASERCRLIVTTHSEVLVDALTEVPESVIVCEKNEGQTTLRRLEKEALTDWFRRYRLGELWASGSIRGNRW